MSCRFGCAPYFPHCRLDECFDRSLGQTQSRGVHTRDGGDGIERCIVDELSPSHKIHVLVELAGDFAGGAVKVHKLRRSGTAGSRCDVRILERAHDQLVMIVVDNVAVSLLGDSD